MCDEEDEWTELEDDEEGEDRREEEEEEEDCFGGEDEDMSKDECYDFVF